MKPSAEIEAVINRYLRARVEGDLETIRNLHSASSAVRLIGSDAHEWYRGPEEVDSFWQQVVAGLELQSAETQRLEAFENGDTGWAAVEQLRTTQDGKPLPTRLTVVLRLEEGVWKVVQEHFSGPLSNVDLLGVELTESLSNLLDSMDASEHSEFNDVSLGMASFVFTDIVDSTGLSQTLGDQAWADLMSRHFAAAADVVAQCGGRVVKTMGDGGMYVFSSAGSALNAAVRIQEVAAASDRLHLRVGVHTGDVVKGEDGDYLGLTVNKAARVAAAAAAEEVLVSANTVDMVNIQYELGAPIAAELKGLDGTHILFPLLWR